MKHAVRNGSLIKEEDAVLPVTRREVFFNFSVYESLKVEEKTALFVEDHIERFFESARILELEHPFTRAALVENIDMLVEADRLQEATIKLILVGGDEPLYIIHSTPLPRYPKEYYREGIGVITYSGERTIPRAKSNCLLLNYIAGREAERNNTLEALLVDRHGKATEGTRSNLFAVYGDELVTAEEDVLYGVTRSHVLRLAEGEGLTLRKEKIGAEDLTSGVYSELFITSTSMGAMPIGRVDGKSVLSGGEANAGTGSPEKKFPFVERFNRELRRLESEELERR